MRSKRIIVLLSGEIACGKSTFRESMATLFGFKSLETRAALEQIAGKEGKDYKKRGFLQRYGRKKDKETAGGWVVDHYQSEILNHDRIIVDAVRIKEQIEAFRRAYGYVVYHIHLNAPLEKRKEWFVKRRKGIDEFITDEEAIEKFEEYSNDPTERNVAKLSSEADLLIEVTDTENRNDPVIRAGSFLKLLAPIHSKNVDIVIGGQFGSEGKGQIAAHLAPEYDCLVRVGGPNAGHMVFNDPPDKFHIIPSGTGRAKDAKIILGPGTVIGIDVLLEEIAKFGLDHSRLLIDENASIINESDIAAELKLDRIGSTKQGVGAATANNLFTNRLRSDDRHKAKNNALLKQYVGSAHEEYQKLNLQNKKILLEGTQGTLLSLHHGFYPHVTSRDTTAVGCLAEAGIGSNRVRKIVLVVRRYPIRVQNPIEGTSGPFESREITFEEVNKRSGVPLNEISTTERTTTTNKVRRIAEFNWSLFRKSCELNTPTDIAFTFADYISYDNRSARRYDQLTAETAKFIEELERCSEVPVSLITTGFALKSIIDRRNWI